MMKTRSRMSFLAIVATTGLACSSAWAQSSSLDASYRPSRTPFGQPDLQGIWSNAVVTPLERPPELADKAFFSEDEAQRYEQRIVAETNFDRRSEDSEADTFQAYNEFWWDDGENVVATRRTSLIIDPPDGRIPYRSASTRRELEQRRSRMSVEFADSHEERPIMERCLNFPSAGPPMLPSFYNNNYQLVQNEDHVLIVNEMSHETRIIPLDDRPPLPNGVRQWLGSSRGHWDGDTLVVETSNFREETGFRGATKDMRLTERFTRVADNILLYEFTVDDPAVFSQPWTAQVPSVAADGLMYEYACHEGNRGLPAILEGARAQEREAAAAAHKTAN